MKAQDRARRVRYKLRTNSNGRTRLSVFKSLQHIYVQAINDDKHLTIACVGTNSKTFPLKNESKAKKAEWVGAEIAKKLIAMKVKDVYLDRGPYAYAGSIKTLAEAARQNGLNF